ncbi:hypothetical protein ACGLWX_00630 [Halomonas sp. HMF6819]|uniref:hypothetical protein n=1 Tax=unclassified Halomonas TaxID=2609666 RepID=UPI0020767C4A|nr:MULTISPECIES: hypothetical protein [unclassified Halomonas]
MDWLNQYAPAINVAISVCTLFVWLFYAQLLYSSFSRQRRPRVIINRGKGIGLEALCLVSNMSTESVYIQHVIAVLHTDSHEYKLDIVEYQQQSDDDEEDCYRTHQGPLDSGDHIHLQSFGSIVNQIQNHWDVDQNSLEQSNLQLEIRVIAIYGPEDLPIGASRRFDLVMNAEPNRQLVPTSIDTERLVSRRSRKQVVQWAKDIELHKAQ